LVYLYGLSFSVFFTARFSLLLKLQQPNTSKITGFPCTATDNYRFKLLKVQRQRQKEGMICYESDEEINKNAVLLEFLSLNRLLVGHTVIKLPFLTITATDACLLTLVVEHVRF